MVEKFTEGKRFEYTLEQQRRVSNKEELGYNMNPIEIY